MARRNQHLAMQAASGAGHEAQLPYQRAAAACRVHLSGLAAAAAAGAAAASVTRSGGGGPGGSGRERGGRAAGRRCGSGAAVQDSGAAGGRAAGGTRSGRWCEATGSRAAAVSCVAWSASSITGSGGGGGSGGRGAATGRNRGPRRRPEGAEAGEDEGPAAARGAGAKAATEHAAEGGRAGCADTVPYGRKDRAGGASSWRGASWCRTSRRQWHSCGRGAERAGRRSRPQRIWQWRCKAAAAVVSGRRMSGVGMLGVLPQPQPFC